MLPRKTIQVMSASERKLCQMRGSAAGAEELTGGAVTTARSNWSSKRYGWKTASAFRGEGRGVFPQLAHNTTSRINAGFRKCYFRTATLGMAAMRWCLRRALFRD